MPVIADEKDETSDRGFERLVGIVRSQGLKVDIDLLTKAYHFSRHAHRDQKRSSGEPYILHPLEVAVILAELKLDTASLITALLHDTVEDTLATLDEVAREFGPTVANLVDGVTKISKISFQTTEEKQAENFRKMILAMAQDLRVILVKLADRLHNMRTLQHLKPEQQVKIAQETLDIYSPLANRLGLSSIKRELEDLGLRYTHPEIYYRLVSQVAKKRKEREKYIVDVQRLIESALREHGYNSTEVTGRPKHFYSIHKKMLKNNLTFDQVYDVTGFRIIVDTVEQCYGALGLIHSLWTPVPGRFKDYIAIPKANFYQSLHTTVIGPGGEHIEIQIRTRKMHETAERGIAAHWTYKEGGEVSQKEKSQFDWLNRLLEWHRDLKDPNEFLETVKMDLFQEEVYVFTPQGEVKEFPQGATPLDFAYAVHTDVGHRCIGARVNNRMVPLKYKLKSGDTVEILTSVNQKPHKDWLKIVKTSRAKSKIRAYIKQMEHDRSLALGSVLLEKALKKLDVKLKWPLKDEAVAPVAGEFSYKTPKDLLSAIGYGKISANKVAQRFVTRDEKEKAPDEPKSRLREALSPIEKIFEVAAKKSAVKHSVKVKGVEDLLVRFARCCNPVPGDAVVGFITRGRGISVHTRSCPKVFESDPHRLVDIEWDTREKTERKVKIRVVCEDRPGLLAEMSKVIRDLNANISRAQIATTKDEKAVCIFAISINDLSHLRKILSKLEGIPGVIQAHRVQKKDT